MAIWRQRSSRKVGTLQSCCCEGARRWCDCAQNEQEVLIEKVLDYVVVCRSLKHQEVGYLEATPHKFVDFKVTFEEERRCLEC